MPSVKKTSSEVAKLLDSYEKKLKELKKSPSTPETEFERAKLKNARDLTTVLTTLSKDKNRGRLNNTLVELVNSKGSKVGLAVSALADIAGIDGVVSLGNALRKLNIRENDKRGNSFLQTIIDDGSLKEVLNTCREEAIIILEDLDEKSLRDILKESDLFAPKIQKSLGLSKESTDSFIGSLDTEALKKLIIEAISNEDLINKFVDTPDILKAKAALHVAQLGEDLEKIKKANANLNKVHQEQSRTPEALKADKKFTAAVTKILTGQNAKEILTKLDTEQLVKIIANSPTTTQLLKKTQILGAKDSETDLTAQDLERILLSSSKEAKALILKVLGSPSLMEYAQTSSAGVKLDEEKMKQVNTEVLNIIKSEEFKTLLKNGSEHLLKICTTSPLFAQQIEQKLGLTKEEFKDTFKDQPELLKNLIFTFLDQDSQTLTEIITNQPNAKQHLIKILASEAGRKFVDNLPADKFADLATRQNTPIAQELQTLTGMDNKELKELIGHSPEASKELIGHLLKNQEALKRIANKDPNAKSDVIDLLTSEAGRKFVDNLPADKFADLATRQNTPIALALQSATGMDSKELKDLIGHSPEASKELIGHLLKNPEALKRIANKDQNAKSDIVDILTSKECKNFINSLSAEGLTNLCTKENTPIAQELQTLTGMDSKELQSIISSSPEASKELIGHLLKNQEVLKRIANKDPNAKNDIIDLLTSDAGRKFVDNLPADKFADLATRQNTPIAQELQTLTGMDSKELKDLIGHSPEASKELIGDLLKNPEALKRIANKDPNAKNDVIDLLTSDAGRKFVDSIPADKFADLATRQNTPIALALQATTGMDSKELKELIGHSPEASKELIGHLLKNPEVLKRIANNDPNAKSDVVDILTSKECKNFINSLSAEGLTNLCTKENTPIAQELQTLTGMDSKELQSIIGSSPEASKAFISSVLEKKNFLDNAAQYVADSKNASNDPEKIKKLQVQKLELQKESVEIITSTEGIKFIESLSAKDFGKLCEKSPTVSEKVSSTLGIPPESAQYLVASLAPSFKDVAMVVLKEEKDVLLNFLEQPTKQETNSNNDLSKKNVVSFTQKFMETVAQNPESIALIVNKQSKIFAKDQVEGKIGTSDVLLAGVTEKTIKEVATSLADPEKLSKLTASLKEFSESPKSTLAKIKLAVTCLSTIGFKETIDLYRETKKEGEAKLEQAKNDPNYKTEFLETAEAKVKETIAKNRATSPIQPAGKTTEQAKDSPHGRKRPSEELSLDSRVTSAEKITKSPLNTSKQRSKSMIAGMKKKAEASIHSAPTPVVKKSRTESIIR